MCCNDQHIQYNSLEEEWNSPERQEVRKAFLEGKVPDRCKSCIERCEQDLGETLPIHMNETIAEVEPAVIMETPRYLHISPSNRCNLACRMCSIPISTMYGRAFGTELKNDNATPEFFEYLRKAAPTLDHYVFHGGDPIYEGNMLKILKILYPYRENIEINVITNGTTTKCGKVDVIPYLKEFLSYRSRCP